ARHVLVSRVFRETGFFFSSRRRHAGLVSDWSADVCSSDPTLVSLEGRRFSARCVPEFDLAVLAAAGDAAIGRDGEGQDRALVTEIGRASCRERVGGGEGAGSLKGGTHAEGRQGGRRRELRA